MLLKDIPTIEDIITIDMYYFIFDIISQSVLSAFKIVDGLSNVNMELKKSFAKRNYMRYMSLLCKFLLLVLDFPQVLVIYFNSPLKNNIYIITCVSRVLVKFLLGSY